jgi:hypothetical protein
MKFLTGIFFFAMAIISVVIGVALYHILMGWWINKNPDKLAEIMGCKPEDLLPQPQPSSG